MADRMTPERRAWLDGYHGKCREFQKYCEAGELLAELREVERERDEARRLVDATCAEPTTPADIERSHSDTKDGKP